ncbi:DUF1593 domain-containing protein [Robiginitalea sp. M366]|uniref:DUF1593 domain-containing protein n=1 Tax=Robiginitalea aestuariiviva TaxID=3036903 RepID=UPI00240E168D|nr:nucleoside hydrolase-like domain-containing protein [Robiginitalea aestuariiviva]MDG1572675.1 DUF1593 domain-containing protein [Robiginitalea aestuariiviva]
MTLRANFLLLVLSLGMLTLGCGESGAGDTTAQTAYVQPTGPRTIVTTDGEIDDVDSFIRMLLYANEFRLEGLVYSSSMWHYKGDGKGTPFTSKMAMTREIYGERTELRWPGTTWMDTLLLAYARVYPNLRLHSPSYPHPDSLKAMVRVGNIDFEGSMARDTEGSDWIKAKLLDEDPEPIYLQVWGGTNTIARALKSIEEEYGGTAGWEAVYSKVCAKAILYAILDQDATYREYIAPNWPDLKVFYNANQFWCFAYPWKRAVPEPWHPYLEGGFMREHLIQGHGPLLAQYYSYGDGQQQAGDPEHLHGVALDSFNLGRLGQSWGPFEPYDFISEGDSPAYLHLVDVGLGNLEHPQYGGWGGRLVPSDSLPNRWEDGEGARDFNPFTDTLDATFPQTRWVPAIQEDFAARADWCVKPFAEANHAPLVGLAHPETLEVLPGEALTLKAVAEDPDGDTLEYQWWQYAEVDSYPGVLNLEYAAREELQLLVPENMESGQELHLVVAVTDAAEHPMTRYRRVILRAR